MKIVLIGKSCSGKTQLALLLKKKGLKVATTATSRPIRPGEEDGVHYYFYEKETFEKMLAAGQFIEHNMFNGWYYGIPKFVFEESNIIIVTPCGLETIKKFHGRENIAVVYVDTPSEERLSRSIKRGDDPKEILRRFGTDEEDFKNFMQQQDWDMRIDQKTDNIFQVFIDLFSQN